MGQNSEILRGVLILVVGGALLIGLIYWTCKRSEEPLNTFLKWLLTLGVLAFMITVVFPLVGKGDYASAFICVPLTAVCGLVVAIIWGKNLGGLVAKPFTSLYDGGGAAPDPVPFYSVARAREKQGKYAEAVVEVRKQLSRFPTDVEGQFLLAQILAEDLQDLPGAQLAIDHFCAQPGHAPKNIVFALYSMADWHLSVGHDKESAKRCLERVVEMLPDTEHSLGASQRIAHLADPTFELEPRKFAVKPMEPRENPYARSGPATAPADDGGNQVTQYIEHLSRHPLDCEVRERLAAAYADHFGRLDLATDQLEQMIHLPNQPARNVVRWLNLLADIQIRLGAELEVVQGTLQRIVDLDPNLAAAELARNRLSLLKLEIKGKVKAQAVRLGAYEQNLGLRGPSPRRWGD
jgi:tetratricopeptide (TPR) repeat protein